MKIALKGAPAAELRFRGEPIRRGNDGMICLTDMWKAAGAVPSKAPASWLRGVATTELARVLEENMLISHVFRQQRGRTGATWAHPLAAISYAKHLSPEFHVWANGVILKQLTEQNKEIDRYRKRGRDDAWIRQRLEGLQARKELTDTLKAHGISEGVEYAVCTNEVYRKLFGSTKRELCIERNLPSRANLRDHLDQPDLAAVHLTEAVAERGIAEQNLNGLHQCKEACSVSAEAIAKAIAHAKQEIAALLRLT